jgi:hypothetical protein
VRQELSRDRIRGRGVLRPARVVGGHLDICSGGSQEVAAAVPSPGGRRRSLTRVATGG